MNKGLGTSGTKYAYFDPVLNVNFDRINYSILVFAIPPGLSEDKTSAIIKGFSKIMYSPESIEEFQSLVLPTLPNFKYLVQDISMSTSDLFLLYSQWIKETDKNSVKIDLSRAWERRLPLDLQGVGLKNMNSPLGSYGGGSYFRFFNDRDNGSPAMKTVYEKSLEILKQAARKIMQGVRLGEVRMFALNGLKRMFREHRRMVGNNNKFQEGYKQFQMFMNERAEKAIEHEENY
ncbi:hypothetical protein TNIN_156901 [Trichonephila inaurata madagascariensis]|uniref:Uncharacterized protein n=1 Tax=Trichonephila inaurata madagascariensis TaxID=2747483 RepID=A0A8X6X1I3_9ARAC|nr:hypothetical protein TNIN_156901 [Trichonephila inaurata madagascariensis]